MTTFGEHDDGPDSILSESDQPECWPERRQYQRYDIDTDLTVRVLPEHPEVTHGHSLDISPAGIAGVFATGWEIGTRVLIQFSVPVSREPLQVEAIVRNRSGYRYGFEFVNLSGRERTLIQKTWRVLAMLE